MSEAIAGVTDQTTRDSLGKIMRQGNSAVPQTTGAPMGREIDLLCDYPKSKRAPRVVTEQERAIARKFGRDFFDGDRRLGYGGYKYDPRFWTATVRRMRDYYALHDAAMILDVGCGRGFMLYDFRCLMPHAYLQGIDISRYAVASATLAHLVQIASSSANDLPFDLETLPCRYGDKPGFDLVISINTIHNLPLIDCKEALREIMRVKKLDDQGGHAFITVDAWRNEAEREAMEAWNLTALTMMSTDDWKQLFADVGYTGDYYWFIPELT